MTNATLQKIQAEFIAKDVLSGIDFETALMNSFNKVNDFLMSLVDNSEFNEMVFNNIKN